MKPLKTPSALKTRITGIGRGLLATESRLIIMAAIYVAILAIGFSFNRILPGAVNAGTIILGIVCSLVAFPIIIVAHYLFMKTLTRVRYAIAAGVSLVVGWFWSLYLCTITPYDDQLVVSTAAKIIAAHDRFIGGIGTRTQFYMEQYPYQSGYGLYLTLLSKIFGPYPFIPVKVINGIIMAISVMLIGAITWSISNNRNAEGAALLLSSVFIPISMSSYKVYGNVLVMPFIMIAVLMAIRTIRHDGGRKPWIDIALLALFSMMSIAIKPNSMIIIIAIIVSLLLHAMISGKGTPVIATAAVLAAALMGGIIPPTVYGRITGSDMVSNKAHYPTWIAIGMLQDHNIYGFYDGNFFPYIKSDVPSKNRKTQEAISRRTHEFIAHPSEAARFYWMKTAETWGDPSFGVLSDNYIQMKSWKKSNNNVKMDFRQLIGNEKGVPQWNRQQLWFYSHAFMPTQVYADGIQIVIMTLAVGGIIIIRRRTRRGTMGAEGMVLGLAFLGGFLFHVAWETKPEYALPYFMMLIPYAGIAMSAVEDRARRILHKHDSTQRGVPKKTQNTTGTGDSGIQGGPERSGDHDVLAGNMEDTLR